MLNKVLTVVAVVVWAIFFILLVGALSVQFYKDFLIN